MKLPVDDARFVHVARAWGIPYVYGAGSPSDAARSDWMIGARSRIPACPPGVLGYDCSGITQVLVVLTGGLIRATDKDRNTAALFSGSDVEPEPKASFGALAFYGLDGRPEHVMFYLGDGVVFGAVAGSPSTFGQDPRSFCDFRRIRYWPGAFLGLRRLRPMG